MDFTYQQEGFLGQPGSTLERISQYKACLEEFLALGYDDSYLQEIRLEMSILLKRRSSE
ncbi:hypothetical protein [Pseudoalteromonas denitrificans]|uniref:Uncharacterized protein n=1 Tax=Pseudoalteromonas denitrificans DSM 6059 TaxID=1123010 RepID=A0A1I1MX53_9GAMM|nr:hypothetical protein [Pseudoalteromonas denitrificans]SFC89939.1 hypothetical protein SAMN02745724_02856 [Pseudoalteromonas denitrificans DSM 6059]